MLKEGQTHDCGRRPLGFQSFSRSSSDMKSTFGAAAAGRLGGREGEVAIVRMWIVAPVGVEELELVLQGVVPASQGCQLSSRNRGGDARTQKESKIKKREDRRKGYGRFAFTVQDNSKASVCSRKVEAA